MHGKEKDVAQPPTNAGVVSKPIGISHISLQNNAHLPPPQHAMPRMQSQTQVPAAIPGCGNGQPRIHAQQNPVSLPQWQLMQKYLRNAQMGYYSQPVPPLANFRPPSANAPATAAPRNPPHSSVLIGNRTNNPDVPIYGPQHGVSVAQPSTVAEYLSLTGNRTHSVPFNHSTPSARPEQHHLQQMYREMYAKQMQGIAIHQQQQHPQLVLPLIPPPPLPPPPPELLGTQFFMQQAPPSAPHIHELPRQSPPSLFSNALHPLIHSRFHSGNNNTTVAAAPTVFVPQNNPLQVPQEPGPVAPAAVAPTAPRPPVYGSAPDTARNVPGINAVAEDLFPLVNPVSGGVDSDAGLLLPPELQNPLSLEAHSKHMVYVHDYLLHLQDQHADYEQQKLLEGMRSLPIPDEIQKQINSSAAAAAVAADAATLIPFSGVPGVAFQDQVDVSMEEEEEDEVMVQAQNAAEKARKEQLKQERRKEQNASNKRKERQRLREEEEARRSAVEQAYTQTKDELIYLNKDNYRLIVAIIVRVRVLVVRDAMLGVFHPLLSARKLLQPQIESASMVEASPPMVETNPPGIVCETLVQNTTNAADPLINNPLAAARDGSPPPRTIPTPSPLVEKQLDLNQQLSVFEINKSLAHVDPEACISYTRQLLVDIAHQVAVAFEDKLPVELVALIESSVIESREVYKRVLEENKDIYYSHIAQLTGNAIVAATKTKNAAAVVLDQGVTKIQLLELRKAEREFTTTDADARSRLHAAQLEIHQLVQRIYRAMASVAGPSHSALAKNNAEVAACVDKWERFSHIRQNLILQLEESFFEIMGPFNYAIVLSKSSPCFPNWGRIVEEIVTMAEQRKLINI